MMFLGKFGILVILALALLSAAPDRETAKTALPTGDLENSASSRPASAGWHRLAGPWTGN